MGLDWLYSPAMSDDEWDRIFLEVQEGEHGPWMCPVCDSDDLTLELGVRFRERKPVASTLYCMLCTAEATARHEGARLVREMR